MSLAKVTVLPHLEVWVQRIIPKDRLLFAMVSLFLGINEVRKIGPKEEAYS
jgi:hypothetical protein